ncbi:TIGR03936 family radical SAM-associated protein [Dethiobacter alkaliphilus]|uniref:TIGR03936 family radical SAM-associated protein n=1 Tax=Dethiobacter alkaliphilus TaxID=427926 RepID=UPI002227F61D|nr:TIGR03936 family radical SAM-associated protein [Dethiobacter alkaliphilus]MCW3489231.1 TIGR03936 family radical SAM-associated protein [Dethiobacter alkaliphilus]
MRLWIKFTKESPLRFLSHLDLMRAWQRAIRRARLPVAYSAGFNPHPKMSFASALAVGITSEAEYLDIQFTESLGEEQLTALQKALPQGMAMTGWREVQDNAPALMALIRAAEWLVPLPQDGLPQLQQKIEQVLQASELTVTREGKKGVKTVDIRPMIYGLHVDEKERLVMLLASGGEGGVRPREVLGLLDVPEAEKHLHRTELLVGVKQCLQSPMHVLLNEKEVSVNAKEDCYQL